MAERGDGSDRRRRVVPQATVDGVTVVLGSASPRRRELLGRLGIAPIVRPTHLDETPAPGETAHETALRLAVEKVAAVPSRPGDLTIAADTLVVIDDVPLGKPANAAEAVAMLSRLSGRSHEVVTGVALRRDGRTVADTDTTEVMFRTLSRGEITAYVATGEPLDKAGAYALQGRAGAFVPTVRGSDTNVIGLPLALTVELAHRLGVDLLRG